MIPIKLEIKNFASYGPKIQTINFEQYNLICLTGKNGHGKSAMLDALTWAIWGQARKVGGALKADEGLLRLGQTNMMVCVDFRCNNTVYRIRREFTQTNKKALSNLEFGIIDINSDDFKPLTDKTIKATQEKIESMIGIDYESFINTAFLRQGQSNEFSKKTPKERKEILGSILGLDKFENLRKLAMQKSRECQTQVAFKKQLVEEFNTELGEKKSLEIKYSILTEALKNLSVQENQVKARIIQEQEKLEEIRNLKNKIIQLNFKKEQIDLSIKEQTSQLMQIFYKWRQVHRGQKNLKDFAKIDTDYNNYYQELKLLQANATKKVILKEKIMALKEAEQNFLKKLNDEFHSQLEVLKSAQMQSNHALSNLELQKDNILKQLTNLQHENSLHDNDLKNINNNINQELATEIIGKETRQFEKRKEYYHKFVAKINTIKAELNDITQKKATLNEQEANCPLCQQGLSAGHKNSLQYNFKIRESFYMHQLNRLNHIIANLKNILHNQHEIIENLKKRINEKQILLVKRDQLIINLDKNLASRKLLDSELDLTEQNQRQEKESNININQQIESTINLQQNSILTNSIFLELKNNLVNLNNELELIYYNPEKEQDLIKNLESLQKIKQEQVNLLHEIVLQNERKESIEKITKQIKPLKREKKEIIEDVAKLTNLINVEEFLNNNLNKLNIDAQKLIEEKEKNIHQVGAIEQELRTLNEKEKVFLKEKEIIKQLDVNQEDYDSIALALSKDGIQALLIEDAIPEIEEEANYLLSRLTDNQAHLTIDSLRDLKSGDRKETLDIKISDPMGIRPYELFSGGEAFRIDFALRIAISKLLARRAGTSLQTLIIDEGFGSQDEEGLNNIMAAIHKIQDSFEKIIIVSHLASMKEQFPVNFFIYKGPDGSVVQVIEQD